MKIVDYLTENDVMPVLTSSSTEGVIREMVLHMKDQGKIQKVDELVEILLERENLGSTGIGNGVAIPHGRLGGLDDIILVFGRSSEGIEFDAHDGQPVYLFFLLVAPEDSAGMHLKSLARISRIMKSPDCRRALIETPEGDGLYDVICREDEKH